MWPCEGICYDEIPFNQTLRASNVTFNSNIIPDIAYNPTDNISIPSDPVKQDSIVNPEQPITPVDPPVDHPHFDTYDS